MKNPRPYVLSGKDIQPRRRAYKKRRSPLYRPDVFRPHRRVARFISECRWTSEEVDCHWRRFTSRDGLKNKWNLHASDFE